MHGCSPAEIGTEVLPSTASRPGRVVDIEENSGEQTGEFVKKCSVLNDPFEGWEGVVRYRADCRTISGLCDDRSEPLSSDIPGTGSWIILSPTTLSKLTTRILKANAGLDTTDRRPKSAIR